MRITNKEQMYTMLRQGKLGSTLRTWDTEDEFVASGFRGRASLRCKKPGVPFRHGLNFEETIAEGRKCFEGCKPDDFVYCESAPDWECTFQGEVQRGVYGLNLFWSTAKTNHRVAMRSARQVYGLQAQLTLQHYLDPADYDDIMCLLELYEDHAIEFSVFQHSLGKLDRRMVVWECRAY